jgi:hypothetical protein
MGELERMSDLSNLEKRKFEKLLGMGSGYVLNFSNSSFAEFVVDSTGLNIYDSRYDYGSGSKANRLRGFWRQENDSIVGKLMGELLDYGVENDFFVGKGVLLEACRRIIARLNDASQLVNGRVDAEGQGQPTEQQRIKELGQLNDEFSALAAESDRSKAGISLEKLLNRLFELSHLRPRQGFRVTGEQIDGSFELDGDIYLIESKWEKDPLPEADLLVFRGKVEAKSTFTRGVFIALNDVSREARDAITRGKAPSFFVMNGHDLIMVLSGAITLADFLRARRRLLAEEGRVCVPFSELA